MTTSAKLAIQAAVAEASLRRWTGHVRDERRRQVFLRLVARHADRIHALARRLGPAWEAEDLVQETFLKAWRGLGRFRNEAELGTWLYRILVNLARDRHRRRSRRPSNLPERALPREPGDQAVHAELLGRIFCAVETLPPRQREALLLRVRAGLCYAEIARVMGVRVGSVKSHLVAARRTLHGRFESELGWGGEHA